MKRRDFIKFGSGAAAACALPFIVGVGETLVKGKDGQFPELEAFVKRVNQHPDLQADFAFVNATKVPVIRAHTLDVRVINTANPYMDGITDSDGRPIGNHFRRWVSCTDIKKKDSLEARFMKELAYGRMDSRSAKEIPKIFGNTVNMIYHQREWSDFLFWCFKNNINGRKFFV